MAEVCLDCYNKYLNENQKALTKRDVKLDNDLCEYCGQIKPCIIVIKERNLIKRFIKYIKLKLYCGERSNKCGAVGKLEQRYYIMDDEELGYYFFILEEEENQKQLEKSKEIHNENKSDLEAE